MAAETRRPRRRDGPHADGKIGRSEACEAHGPRRPGGAAADSGKHRAHADAGSAGTKGVGVHAKSPLRTLEIGCRQPGKKTARKKGAAGALPGALRDPRVMAEV